MPPNRLTQQPSATSAGSRRVLFLAGGRLAGPVRGCSAGPRGGYLVTMRRIVVVVGVCLLTVAWAALAAGGSAAQRSLQPAQGRPELTAVLAKATAVLAQSLAAHRAVTVSPGLWERARSGRRWVGGLVSCRPLLGPVRWFRAKGSWLLLELQIGFLLYSCVSRATAAPSEAVLLCSGRCWDACRRLLLSRCGRRPRNRAPWLRPAQFAASQVCRPRRLVRSVGRARIAKVRRTSSAAAWDGHSAGLPTIGLCAPSERFSPARSIHHSMPLRSARSRRSRLRPRRSSSLPTQPRPTRRR